MAREPSLPDQLPPQSIEAEQAVLGAALISKTAALWVTENLTAEHYHYEMHRKIHRVVAHLVLSGAPVDLFSVPEELRRREQLEGCGGQAYINTLTESAPTAAHVEYYGKIVRKKYVQRRLIQVAGQITEGAYEDPDDLDELLAKAESSILEISQERPRVAAEPISRWLEEAREVYHPGLGPASGLKLGFPSLDRRTGGLAPTDLMVLGARSSVGKSSIAIAISVNVADYEKAGVLIYSREMQKEALRQRFMANLSGVSSLRIRRRQYYADEWENVEAATHLWKGLPIYIHALRDYSTPQQMVAHARRELREHPEIRLVIVDHVQTFPLPGRRGSHHETKAIVDSIKEDLCQGLMVPCLLLSQINRGAEDSKRKGDRRPELHHLKESGSIEEIADEVVLAYRQNYYLKTENVQEPDEGITELMLWKSRLGERGVTKLLHSLSRCQYKEVDDVHQEPPPERGRGGP